MKKKILIPSSYDKTDENVFIIMYKFYLKMFKNLI